MSKRVPSIRVREMAPADFPAVRRLWEAAGMWPHFGEGHQFFMHFLERSAGLGLVAEAGGAVIGWVSAGCDGHRGWVHRLVVAPDHRGCGAGTRLLAEAERRLFERNCVQVNLMVRHGEPHNLRFYSARGYRGGACHLMSKHNPACAVQAIIFDLGNVVLPFDHRRAARAAARRSPLASEVIYQRLFGDDLVAKYDAGRLSTRAFLREVRDRIDYRGTLADLRRAWDGIFRRDRAMERLVASLAPRYTLVLLSNTNRSHFEFVWRTFSVVRTFRRRVISWQVGLLKPDPAIFRLAVERSGAPPERCLYVDDIPAYTDAAADLGLLTHCFRGAADLRRALRAYVVAPS